MQYIRLHQLAEFRSVDMRSSQEHAATTYHLVSPMPEPPRCPSELRLTIITVQPPACHWLVGFRGVRKHQAPASFQGFQSVLRLQRMQHITCRHFYIARETARRLNNSLSGLAR